MAEYLAEHRMEMIMSELAARGECRTRQLAVQFQLSEMTLRRDLAELESRGLLKRVHGGAVLLNRDVEYAKRMELGQAQKQRVGRAATRLLKSGQTVYLAGGAILRAKIPPDEKPVQEKNWRGNKVWAALIETGGAKDVKVRGRGILDMGPLPWHARTAMRFGGSTDILVEGIVILDAPAWVVAMHNSKNVVVRNVKQICARENSDGIDICNSQDVLVEDCFLRNNDDEVCVKTISSPPAMESKNIVVRRCVVWNDRARGLGITSETRANISNVLFKDCDIIHDFSSGGECSALAVLVSDSGTMSDIRFENIRVEDSRNTLVNCWIGADMWGHDKTRGHIKGVTFKDILVTGKTVPVMKLNGCDDKHLIDDVRIENVRIQGSPIRSAETAKLQTNAYVRGLAIVAGPDEIQKSANKVPEDTARKLADPQH